ncbi:tripartite tricarboxylate transporter substrate binding protein [Bradyrhizobium lablabi]|uniref:Bug family tripartite tricarboxylate transporter substrate binding protein n=1 Tax=Bradyrhizobium lablabi TaxID=722472 RepID=UPI001BA4AEBD|nr:tripartite tricarboxylate transporter substrate binding protein [Bradyrhizobium lablabi]MBR1119993.1 tripartite tricarboxylate transporter substrate binding protein [Bradyrhizobium lablabi]
MMYSRRSCLAGLSALGVLAALPATAFAQADYPNRPLRIVVGFAPGGSNDIVARLLAEKLQKSLGQPAVVENKPGGGGAVAAAFVKSQPADGYTLMVGASGAMVVGPAIGAPAQYDTLADFEPVSILGTFPLVLIVNADSPHKTLKDLVAWSKANPSSSNYASASPTFTLAAELFKLRTGAMMQRVSYRGSNDSVMAVLGNQVTASMVDTLPAMPLLKDGKLRALAVTSTTRLAELPDVPTMAEAGVTGAEAVFWTGLFVPKGTPKEIVGKLEAEAKTTMQDPEVRQRLRALATEAASNSPAEFTSRITNDLKAWSEVAKTAKVTLE